MDRIAALGYDPIPGRLTHLSFHSRGDVVMQVCAIPEIANMLLSALHIV